MDQMLCYTMMPCARVCSTIQAWRNVSQWVLAMLVPALRGSDLLPFFALGTPQQPASVCG